MPEDNWDFPELDPVDLSHLDRSTIKKLVGAILWQALHDAKLLEKWCRVLEAGHRSKTIPIYNTAIAVTLLHQELTDWTRSRWAQELLDYVRIDSHQYWFGIKNRLRRTLPFLATASLVIRRGPPTPCR